MYELKDSSIRLQSCRPQPRGTNLSCIGQRCAVASRPGRISTVSSRIRLLLCECTPSHAYAVWIISGFVTSRVTIHVQGVPMTQNTCVSNIDTPGSVLPTNNSANPYGSRVGPCPILRDATVEEQLNLPSHDLLDMVDIDRRYDMAAASFIRNATGTQRPWFFYFSSHHTHVPQFAPEELTGFSVRGLMGDSLSVLDRSVGRLLNLTQSLGIDEQTMVLFSADNGGARYWGPDVGGVNGELRCGKETTYPFLQFTNTISLHSTNALYE